MASRDLRFDFSKDFPLPNDEQRVAALAKANGADTAELTVHGVFFIVRTPSPEAWLRYVETLKASKIRSAQQFVIDCALWPEPAELQKVFQRFPVIAGPLVEELSTLGGGDESPLAKLL